MRTAFHAQLDALLAQLSALCRLTEVALTQATHALLETDLTTAEQVITDHDLVAALAQRCEERAVTLLALQAPVARDLRTVVATLNLVDDLLRMGVLAQHVARIARRRHPACAVPAGARTVITDMAEAAGNPRHREGAAPLASRPSRLDWLSCCRRGVAGAAMMSG